MKRNIIFLLIIWPLVFSVDAFAQTKKADLAGSWYPADRKELSILLDAYYNAANPPATEGKIIAIISPHAGLVYSGPVAAYGYKLLCSRKVGTLVILALSHRKHYDGISVYSAGEFSTPLGNLKVNEEMASAIIAKSNRIKFYPQVFEGENSLEIQLPFIKKALPEVKIVPIIFGTSDYNDCKILSGILSEILSQRDDVVVIASTDMSHYNPYRDANRIDAETIELMKQFRFQDIYAKATSNQQPCCGYMPVVCVLMLAEKLAAKNFEVLKYANSGDTTGDKTQPVVGYLSAVIYKSSNAKHTEDKGMLNQAQRKRLLEIARESITTFIKTGKKQIFQEADPVFNQPLGAFVTLHENGELRGCIGNMVGSGPLYKTVADMAIEAAVADPRFPQVSAKELDNIDIEISVLSVMERVKDASQIKIPGHGVLVRKGYRSGVYLPQVATETGWNREEFLTSLCGQKAGLPADAWKDLDTELYVFTAEVFGEKR